MMILSAKRSTSCANAVLRVLSVYGAIQEAIGRQCRTFMSMQVSGVELAIDIGAGVGAGAGTERDLGMVMTGLLPM